MGKRKGKSRKSHYSKAYFPQNGRRIRVFFNYFRLDATKRPLWLYRNPFFNCPLAFSPAALRRGVAAFFLTTRFFLFLCRLLSMYKSMFTRFIFDFFRAIYTTPPFSILSRRLCARSISARSQAICTRIAHQAAVPVIIPPMAARMIILMISGSISAFSAPSFSAPSFSGPSAGADAASHPDDICAGGFRPV